MLYLKSFTISTCGRTVMGLFAKFLVFTGAHALLNKTRILYSMEV